VFYEPGSITADELEVLRAYAADRGLVVRSRAEFAEEVFLRTAWDRRGLITGHNLPFDLARRGRHAFCVSACVSVIVSPVCVNE
jgi:hypothetical protein